MSVNSYAELNAYKEKIKALCTSADACLAQFKQIYHEYTFVQMSDLTELVEKLGQTNFKVIVIGKFSTGKSTLINTILGDDVLPDSLNPCTAYINEVVYGEEKQATLYFKEPLPAQWDKFVQKEELKQHIQKYAPGNVPTYVIDLDELSDCVTIPCDEEGEPLAQEECGVSPFEKAVIQYPCEICKSGVEIIDSPGLDESQDRTEIVGKYLKKVDAVIYVTTNIATGGDGDKEIIDAYLVQNDIKNVFFVCNLFGVKLEKAEKQLRGRLNKIFAGKTLLGERGVHLVNACAMGDTGIPRFEEALSTYLSNERGQAQLTSYIERLTKVHGYAQKSANLFPYISKVKLDEVCAQIADVEGRLALEGKLLREAKTAIAQANYKIETLCRNEGIEKFKKLSYNARMDIKDKNVGDAALTNDATEEPALVLADALAKDYLAAFIKSFEDYFDQELRQDLKEEISTEVQYLQEHLDAFAASVGEQAKFAPIAFSAEKLKATYNEAATALASDLQELFSFTKLNVPAILKDLVHDVFVVYSSYRYEARGAKLTEEVEGKVSMEIYKRLEREKRTLANAVIKEILTALENRLYAGNIETMEKAIATQEALLADLKALKAQTEHNLELEKEHSAKVLEQLQQNLISLAVLQKEIDD